MPTNTTHRSISISQLSREDLQRFERPILYQANQKAFWLASGGVALFGALVIGALASKLGSMGVVFVAAAAAWFVLATTIVIRQVVRARGLPIRAGLYAIGHELIDATGHQLKIYAPLDSPPKVTVTHVNRENYGYLYTRVKIATRSRTFRFNVHGEELARVSTEALLGNLGAAHALVHTQGAMAIRPYELAYAA